MPDLESINNFLLLSDRVATGGQPSQDQLVSLAQAGYVAVVNLGLHDTDYALLDEGSTVASLGMIYEHIPVPFEQPSAVHLQLFFKVMKRFENDKCFVHCAANKRVSVFMALKHILQDGWDTDKAMKNVHSLWQPDPVWETFIATALARQRR